MTASIDSLNQYTEKDEERSPHSKWHVCCPHSKVGFIKSKEVVNCLSPVSVSKTLASNKIMSYSP